MKKLAIYLKPYWKATVLAPLFMLIEVVTDLYQPRLMAEIVDEGIANGDTNFIIHTGLMMLGIAFIGLLGGIGAIVFSSIAAQNFGTDLRNDLFTKVQSFSFVSLDKFKTASLITRLTNDITQVQAFVLIMLRILVRSPLMFMGGLFMALGTNPGLSLILVVTIPVLAFSLGYIISHTFPIFRKVQAGLDKVNTVMRENLTGVRVVKAFVRSDYEIDRFGDVNDQYMNMTIKASRLMGLIMPIMLTVLNLSVLAVLWFGGIKVNNGNMQVGQVMAFINYMALILFSLMMAGFMMMMISRAKVSADRVEEVLRETTDISDKENASDSPITSGRVDFENVSFQYQGASGEPVLKNINFTALPRETVAILGATGSGKSTLVHLIPRFYEASQGRVLIDGTDVRDYKLDTLRQGISMALQESILFSGTVRENLRWGKQDATEEEIIEAAEAAQAHDFIMKLPAGYDTVLGQRGINLSGGQKQRIAIARALIKKPALLIFDDSTSAVDVTTESQIQEAIKIMAKHATVIVIAQRITTVLDADKILVLEDGKIVGCGTHGELLKTNKVYQEIYYSQLGEEVV